MPSLTFALARLSHAPLPEGYRQKQPTRPAAACGPRSLAAAAVIVRSHGPPLLVRLDIPRAAHGRPGWACVHERARRHSGERRSRARREGAWRPRFDLSAEADVLLAARGGMGLHGERYPGQRASG